VIRRLPRNISTRAQRDSLFKVAMPTPTKVNRVELWCLDCCKEFGRVKDYARAEEWARRGLKIGYEPMEGHLQSELAVALWRQARVDSAEVRMRIAVEKIPASPTFRMFHAAILRDLSRRREALEELQTAYELSNHDPRIHVSIAQVLGELGRYEDAVSELLQVPPGNEQRGLALRDAAIVILNHLDRPGNALEYLKESIQIDPNQEQADLVRAQIAQLEAVLHQK
jgi:tetratricopeptide (TPR) repeat protein